MVWVICNCSWVIIFHLVVINDMYVKYCLGFIIFIHWAVTHDSCEGFLKNSCQKFRISWGSNFPTKLNIHVSFSVEHLARDLQQGVPNNNGAFSAWRCLPPSNFFQVWCIQTCFVHEFTQEFVPLFNSTWFKWNSTQSSHEITKHSFKKNNRLIYDILQSTKHRMLRTRLYSFAGWYGFPRQKKSIHFGMAGLLIDVFFLFPSTFLGGRNILPHLLAHFYQHLMWFSDTIDLRRLQDCKTCFFFSGKMVQT